MHIQILTPHITPRPAKLAEVQDFQGLGGLVLSQCNIDFGPESIQNGRDEVLAAPGVLEKAVFLEARGVDAIIIDCFGDPGLRAVREAVSIPVVGPGEACMYFAAMLGRRFSVVSVTRSVIPMIEEHAAKAGLSAKLRSVRVVDTPVLQIEEAKVGPRLVEEALLAVRNDGADAVILGCTGFTGVADKVREDLRAEGLEVPVLAPLRTAVMMALMMLKLDIRHSRALYPSSS